MAYYKSLDKEDFDNVIADKIKSNPMFLEVTDLNEYKCPGIYILVLDEYKQLYVGIAKNIKTRIQIHWTANKDLGRLVFGGVTESKLSIDSFRALDTTRIFACAKDISKDDLWKEEYNITNSIPEKYLCNRMLGGDPLEQIQKDDCFKFAELPVVTKDNISDILPDYTWEYYTSLIK